jgi:hypothetical protein
VNGNSGIRTRPAAPIEIPVEFDRCGPRGEVRRSPDPAPRIVSVVTAMKLAFTVEAVWERLMFYEQIEKRPPWLLRRLLPVPLRTVGHPSEVGAEIKCLYRNGYLTKRVTGIIRRGTYKFEVIEQNLALGGGIKLVGGSYTLSELADGRTKVSLKTRYVSGYHPRWLCGWMEARICHMFHGHILRAMRDSAAPR